MKANQIFESFNERDMKKFLQKLRHTHLILFPSDIDRLTEEYYQYSLDPDGSKEEFVAAWKSNNRNLMTTYFEYGDVFLDVIVYIIENA